MIVKNNFVGLTLWKFNLVIKQDNKLDELKLIFSGSNFHLYFTFL